VTCGKKVEVPKSLVIPKLQQKKERFLLGIIGKKQVKHGKIFKGVTLEG
jgi:hypothetical protein